jgi:hypothetical protein
MAPFILELNDGIRKFSRDFWSTLYTMIFYVTYLVSLYVFFTDTANSAGYMKFPYISKIGELDISENSY